MHCAYADCRGYTAWSKIWDLGCGPHIQVICKLGGFLHLCLRGWVCVVLGPTWMVGPQRDIPIGDSISGAEYQCVSEHALHLLDSPSLPYHAMPYEVWPLLLLCLLGRLHDHLRLLLHAWDQKCAHRRGCLGLEEALVLEQVHFRWWHSWRNRDTQWKWQEDCGLIQLEREMWYLLLLIFFFPLLFFYWWLLSFKWGGHWWRCLLCHILLFYNYVVLVLWFKLEVMLLPVPVFHTSKSLLWFFFFLVKINL